MKTILISFFLFAIMSHNVTAQANSPKDTSIIVHAKPGITQDEFNLLLNSDKLVLVDYYADWCIPCKKLAPVIEQISKEMKDKVTVVRVNQDENKPLMDALKVWELPTLQIYKNKTLQWTGEGVFPKEMIEEQLK